MSKVNWSNAPSGATHALTTAPNWQGDKSRIGSVIFCIDINGDKFALDGEDSELWIDEERGWVVLESLEPQNESPDMVNHPPHYQSDNGIECIDAIRSALGKEGFIAYCRGNAIKYSWRDKIDNAEDFNKAAWYSNRAAEESTTKV